MTPITRNLKTVKELENARLCRRPMLEEREHIEREIKRERQRQEKENKEQAVAQRKVARNGRVPNGFSMDRTGKWTSVCG